MRYAGQKFTVSSRNFRVTKRRIWRSVIGIMNAKGRPVEVNVSKLNKLANRKGVLIVVPGKVLGSGTLDKQITVGASGFSRCAVEKISKSGGKVMDIDEFIATYPNGKGVIIVGS